MAIQNWEVTRVLLENQFLCSIASGRPSKRSQEHPCKSHIGRRVGGEWEEGKRRGGNSGEEEDGGGDNKKLSEGLTGIINFLCYVS